MVKLKFLWYSAVLLCINCERFDEDHLFLKMQ